MNDKLVWHIHSTHHLFADTFKIKTYFASALGMESKLLLIAIVLLSLVTLAMSVPVLDTDNYQLSDADEKKLYELIQRDVDLQQQVDETVAHRPKSTRSMPKDAKASNNRHYVILLG